MSSPTGVYRTPYTDYPGGPTPAASTTPEEGTADLWAFFWLAFINTAIIVGVGLAAWFYVR
ncbi:MAG: hypothetical protein L3K02_05740 [Thermoplasmata archaeon]|nr:hypothetical protein [Thermoplasmata archaeon]